MPKTETRLTARLNCKISKENKRYLAQYAKKHSVSIGQAVRDAIGALGIYEDSINN